VLVRLWVTQILTRRPGKRGTSRLGVSVRLNLMLVCEVESQRHFTLFYVYREGLAKRPVGGHSVPSHRIRPPSRCRRQGPDGESRSGRESALVERPALVGGRFLSSIPLHVSSWTDIFASQIRVQAWIPRRSPGEFGFGDWRRVGRLPTWREHHVDQGEEYSLISPMDSERTPS
jgi:hypothetical protein